MSQNKQTTADNLVNHEQRLVEAALMGPVCTLQLLNVTESNSGEYEINLSLRRTVSEEIWQKAFGGHPLETSIRWKDGRVKMMQQVPSLNCSEGC